jgi:hypothetical protein
MSMDYILPPCTVLVYILIFMCGLVGARLSTYELTFILASLAVLSG